MPFPSWLISELVPLSQSFPTGHGWESSHGGALGSLHIWTDLLFLPINHGNSHHLPEPRLGATQFLCHLSHSEEINKHVPICR